MRNCCVRELGRIDYAQRAANCSSELVARAQAGARSRISCCCWSTRTSSRWGATGTWRTCWRATKCWSARGIAFYPTDRGGDVTYHGPGQLVGYPILDLRDWKRDVGAYVRGVEQVIIDTLADYGIDGRPDPEADRRLGGRAEDRGHRRAHQPLGHLARLRAERRHRFELFPVHRSVRVDQAGDLHGAAGRARHAGRGRASVWPRTSAAFSIARCCSRRRRSQLAKERTDMTDVVMPQMGESIVEGTLTKWLKKPGERVERDEPLFEISTDKVDTEIPSPAAGTLSEVLVEEGKTVGINTVVARIDEGGGAARRASAAAAPPTAPRQPPNRAAAGAAAAPPPPPRSRLQPPPAPGGRSAARARSGRGTPPAEPAGPLSPLVRKMAREYNIDLTQVKGTGAGGRITKQDVEAYMARSAGRRAAGRTAAAPPPRRRPQPLRAARCAAAPAAPPRRRATAAGRTGQDAHRADEHHAAARSPSTW